MSYSHSYPWTKETHHRIRSKPQKACILYSRMWTQNAFIGSQQSLQTVLVIYWDYECWKDIFCSHLSKLMRSTKVMAFCKRDVFCFYQEQCLYFKNYLLRLIDYEYYGVYNFWFQKTCKRYLCNLSLAGYK